MYTLTDSLTHSLTYMEVEKPVFVEENSFGKGDVPILTKFDEFECAII